MMEQTQIHVTSESFQKLRELIEYVISSGESGDKFVDGMRALAQQHGWDWFAPGSKQDFNWRAMQLYRAVSRGRYCEERLAQLRAGNFAWWVYKAGVECMEQHGPFDGIALVPDHEFWTHHAPPSTWECECSVYGTGTEAGIKRLGGDPEKELPAWCNELNLETGQPRGVEEPWDQGPMPPLELIVAAIAGGDAPPRPE